MDKTTVMDTTAFPKSVYSKILLSFVIVLGIITIVKAGYDFGQWLFEKIH